MRTLFYRVVALTVGLHCSGGYAQEEESDLYGAELQRKEAEASCRQWAEIDEVSSTEMDKFMAECVADYMNETIETDDTAQ